MNSKENSTASGGGAILHWRVSATLVEELSRLIDRKGGLLTKASAAKHLSLMALNEVSEQLEGSGVKRDGDYVDVRFHRDYVEHLVWIISELWEVNLDLARLVDDFHVDFTDISDAAYRARQATAGAA